MEKLKMLFQSTTARNVATAVVVMGASSAAMAADVGTGVPEFITQFTDPIVAAVQDFMPKILLAAGAILSLVFAPKLGITIAKAIINRAT